MSPRLPPASPFPLDFCPVCCAEVETGEADDIFRRDGEGIAEVACPCGSVLRVETYAVREYADGVSLEHRVTALAEAVSP